MKYTHFAGIALLAILFVWLSQAVLRSGFNLKNLLVVAISFIIIFVPLWKKYLRQNPDKRN